MMRIILNKGATGNPSELIIDGRKALLTEIGFFVPEFYLRDKNFKTNDLPFNTTIHICVGLLGDTPARDSSSLLDYFFERLDSNKINIGFQLCIDKESWNEDLDISIYTKKVKDAILDRERVVGDVVFDKQIDNEEFFCLDFHSIIDYEDLDDAFMYAEDISFDIQVSIDAALKSPIRSLINVHDEAEFTKDILIPLFRRQGFRFVRYNHGVREFGKDLVFLKESETDYLELWAAQVKFGDIHGGSKGDTYSILNQIKAAFSIPIIDLYNGKKLRISKLLIVSSGNITENAKEEIYGGIEYYLSDLKDRISFLDREGIEDLIFRYF